jgi:hypothetical protein
MQTPVLLEGLKDQADDPLGLLVGVELIITVGSPDIPHGGMIQQFAGDRPRVSVF